MLASILFDILALQNVAQQASDRFDSVVSHQLHEERCIADSVNFEQTLVSLTLGSRWGDHVGSFFTLRISIPMQVSGTGSFDDGSFFLGAFLDFWNMIVRGRNRSPIISIFLLSGGGRRRQGL